MKKGSEVFVRIDTAEVHNAVAVAEADRDGEVRYLGTFDNTPDAVVRLLRKLAGRYEALHFCCEAGSTGHGLYRQILPYDGVKTTVFAPKRSKKEIIEDDLDLPFCIAHWQTRSPLRITELLRPLYVI
jgi:hypothetical protein